MEVRHLATDTSPKGSDWLLIEKEGDGFTVSGIAHRSVINASFSSHGLDTPEAAIKASVAWADLLGIPLLYVRD